MNFTENEQKLLLQHSTMIRYIYRQLGWDRGVNAHTLDNYTQVVESERTEPIHRGMTIGSRHDSVDEFVKANTVTEPDVQDGGDVKLTKRQEMKELGDFCDVFAIPNCLAPGDLGIQTQIHSWHGWLARAKWDTATAPDVPYKHCSACGMRSHGTNAELRAKLDVAEVRTKTLDRYIASEIALQKALRKTMAKNAELRSQVDELRAKLDKANELAVLANNIIEKAGGA